MKVNLSFNMFKENLLLYNKKLKAKGKFAREKMVKDHNFLNAVLGQMRL